MSKVYDEVREKLKFNMITREENKLSTLRMVISKISEQRNAKNSKFKLTDKSVVKVIKKEIKELKEERSAEMLRNNEINIKTLTEKINYLQTFLPEELSEEVIKKDILMLIKDLSLSRPIQGKHMGQLMKSAK